MARVTEDVRWKSFLVQRLPVWILAALLRILAWLLCSDFLSHRAELVVPQNSFRRLADGVHMRANGILPYDGDMLHCQPMMLSLFSLLVDRHCLLLCLFIMFDICIAELLRISADAYLQQSDEKDVGKTEEEMLNWRKGIADLVAKCYLLNPIAIGTCAIFSLSIFYNLVMALFIYSFVKGWLVRCAIFYSLFTSLTLYPVILFCALIVKFKTAGERVLLAAISLVSFAFFTYLNYVSNGSDLGFIDSTYGFLLDVRDLSPNVGIFWYFFIEVFNHFRLFFLWVFQINILVYVFPLLLTLRDNSFLLLHLYLILISVFSSYPSMAESLIYLSLVPAFVSLHKYIRWGLLIGGTLVTCTVLASIMWLMWVVIGSGNANFYFATTLAYSVAQIFLLTDLLYAYLHKKVAKERGEDAVKDCACFVLK